MAVGGGGGGGGSAIRAGRAFVEMSLKDDKLSQGLDDMRGKFDAAKGKLNQFAEGAKKAFTAFGGTGVVGDLLGGVGGLGGLAGVAGMLGPQGALAVGVAALGFTVGKAALGFDALSEAQDKGKQLTEESAKSYDRLVGKILAAAVAADDLTAAGQAQTAAVNDYLRAEREANALRAKRDELEKARGDGTFLNPDPAQKAAGQALQELYPKLAAAEADLAVQKERRAKADGAVKSIEEKLLEEQVKILDGLRKEIDLRKRSNDERLREAFLKLRPSAEKLTEFDQVQSAAKAAAEEAKAKERLLELTRKESERGMQVEKSRLATIEGVTKALREQVEVAELSPVERVRRELEGLNATKDQIEQATKDAAELERIRGRPEAVRRAFRDAFGGRSAPPTTLVTPGGAFGASVGGRQFARGADDVGRKQLKVQESIDDNTAATLEAVKDLALKWGV